MIAPRLLYYNPPKILSQTDLSLPGMKKFSSFFKIYTYGVVPIDRTHTIRTPIRTRSLFPIPPFRPFTKSYEEICNERALELLKRAEVIDVPLYVLWSGGIDSTLVLVSLLKNSNSTQKNKITVLLTDESITENPNFYREHIYGKLRVESSTKFPHFLGGNHLLVAGEHNDQLFGSDVIGRLILKFGPSAAHQPYNRGVLSEFFNDSIRDAAVTNFYLDMFEQLKKVCPVPIVTNFDLLWWVNFSMKWQCVFMRILSFTAPRNASQITEEYIRTRYAVFYNTDDFQLWSMNNPDKKIKDTWNTYKWPCKDIIFDYTKDADYRDNKIKRGSLQFLVLQQGRFNFIDETMKLSYEMDPSMYFNPVNDFV